MAEEQKDSAKFIATVVAVALAGAGGSAGYRVVDNPRPDPFTGTDGRMMEQRLQREIDRVEERLYVLERVVIENQKDSGEWQDRTIRLEEKLRYGK